MTPVKRGLVVLVVGLLLAGCSGDDGEASVDQSTAGTDGHHDDHHHRAGPGSRGAGRRGVRRPAGAGPPAAWPTPS